MEDSELKNGKRPVWIGLEEGGQSNEIESVMGWAHHINTVALVIIVGDHKQLPPNVMTKNINRPGDSSSGPKHSSLFAQQMCLPFFTRLAQFGVFVYMFREQYRAVERLSDIYISILERTIYSRVINAYFQSFKRESYSRSQVHSHKI